MGKKKGGLTTSYFRDALCVDGLYEFFANERLRFLLNDVLGSSCKISGKGRHEYNPAMVYLMFKHNHKFATKSNWWHSNSSSVRAKQIIGRVVDKWNAANEDRIIDIDDARGMINASFEAWEKVVGDKPERYVKFGDSVKLVDFFKHYFDAQSVPSVISMSPFPSTSKQSFVLPFSNDSDEEMIEEHVDYHYLMDTSYDCDNDRNNSCENDEDHARIKSLEVQASMLNARGEDHVNLALINDKDHSARGEDHVNLAQLNDKDHSALCCDEDRNIDNVENNNVMFHMVPVRTELEKNYMCDICGYLYTQKKFLIAHLKIKHQRLLCNICDMHFSFDDIVSHMHNIHDKKNFSLLTCDICGFICCNRQTFSKHTKNHVKQKTYACKFCKSTFESLHKKHMHQKSCKIQVPCKFKECKVICTSMNCYQFHIRKHKCILCKIEFPLTREAKMHEITHLHKPCNRCAHYMILDLKEYLDHLRFCTASDKTLYENAFVKNIKDSYNVLKDTSTVSIANVQHNGQHKESLFDQSILLRRNDAGEILFDNRDGYPFWREDFCSPMYGDFSYNPIRNPTSDIRKSNVMHPSSFKAFSHDIFPIGSSAAIKFNKLLGLVEYSVQRFELKRWKEFNDSGLKLPRSKFPFKKNSDLPAFLQKFPDTYGINFDRGHLTPYFLACCIEDQREFQYQGNIFFQLSSQNRGAWKSLEMSIPKRMEVLGATVADITTAVVYARNKDGTFVTENEITKVQAYFKVIFYKNDNGKIIDINCFKINQYPTADVTVSQVSLYDIDSIENNHYLFLNADLLKSIDSKILDMHKQSMKHN